MPTNYDGKSGNVVAPAALSIASSTNPSGTPIQVTVSGSLPADFLTGIKVDIQNHLANTLANGVHTATVTGASTFTIDVNGNGGSAGGANGTVQPLNLTPFFNYPSDGDNDNSASIASWAQSTGDRTTFLAIATGGYKLVGFGYLGSDIGGVVPNSLVTNDTLTGSVWATVPGSATVGLQQMQNTSTNISWLVGGVTSTDIVEFIIETTAQCLSTGSGNSVAGFALGYQPIVYTNSPTAAIASPTFTPSFRVATQGSSELAYAPIFLHALVVHPGFPSSNSGGYVQFAPYADINGSAAETANLVGDHAIYYRIWRPTGMPQ